MNGSNVKMNNSERITRRFLLKTACFGGIAAIFSSVTETFAAEPLDYNQLSLTLYPKTEAEKKYLKEVAVRVKKKKIPQKIAYAAWTYSVKKQKTARLRYFSETLATLCRHAGVKLDIKAPKI